MKKIDINKEELKRKFEQKLNRTKDFIINNRQELIGIGTVLLPVLTVGVKHIVGHRKIKLQKTVKENYCYDRSLGHYWELKRKLTNNEWINIEDRKRNGETLANILSSMKVLK